MQRSKRVQNELKPQINSALGEQPLLVTEGLSKNYHDLHAVSNVDIRVQPGEIFGLVGADGAGKTTILQMLCGILAPSSGAISVAGYDVVRHPDAVRALLGYMSQDFTLYLDMTVEENIDFIAGLRSIPEDRLREEKQRLLHFARMAPFKDRKAGALSGGMKKKLALCCALVHRPRLLLLDEPTTAVDPVSRGELWRILYEFILQGISVIIATPYMDEAERCNRVALIENGRVVACDTPAALKTRLTTSVCSFKSERLNEARRILRVDMGIETQVYGGNLRVFLSNPDVDFPNIKSRLDESGIHAEDFSRVAPNMGDVYLSLLSAQDSGKPKEVPMPPGSGIVKGGAAAAIVVRSISKQYGKFKALDDVSLEVAPGTVFGLLGPNGAGKTTLIKILCGLVTPTSGEAFIAGHNVATERKLAKSKIGYMSQLFSLYPDLTVAQNLDFYATIYELSRSEKKSKIAWVIELAGLAGMEKHLTRDLPTGWKQKVALGAAVMHQPTVLFLDEPTSGVDPVVRAEFWDIIHSLSETGVTTVVTTHFMDEAERCTLLGLVSAGQLIGMGSPDRLKDELEVDCYEVATSTLLQTYNTLSSLDFVQQAALYGDTVHMVTRTQGSPITVEVLRAAGVNVAGVVRISPTLEDVFMHRIIASQGEISA
jgi:ABC-2 type transport system ATP-binding protein